jgi:hypothetical protein
VAPHTVEKSGAGCNSLLGISGNRVHPCQRMTDASTVPTLVGHVGAICKFDGGPTAWKGCGHLTILAGEQRNTPTTTLSGSVEFHHFPCPARWTVQSQFHVGAGFEL